MENEMETGIIEKIYWGYSILFGDRVSYWGYNGIMEKQMETTI